MLVIFSTYIIVHCTFGVTKTSIYVSSPHPLKMSAEPIKYQQS